MITKDYVPPWARGDFDQYQFVVSRSITRYGTHPPGRPTSPAESPEESETLVADVRGINAANGTPASLSICSFQWVRVDAMSNATDISTDSTYTLAADVGKRVKVKVSFADQTGFADGPLVSIAHPEGTRPSGQRARAPRTRRIRMRR